MDLTFLAENACASKENKKPDSRSTGGIGADREKRGAELGAQPGRVS